MNTNKNSHELPDEQLIRSYLLGDLLETEEDRVQALLFTDPDFFENVLIIEDELIDEYLRRSIAAQDREKLEREFLASPRLQRKVEFMKALDRYISKEDPTARLEAFNRQSIFAWLHSGVTKFRWAPSLAAM